MSSHPSLRHLYDFSGWVIQEIQVTPKIDVVKFHRDRRHSIYCPHCIRKAALNKKVMQSAFDLPIEFSVYSRRVVFLFIYAPTRPLGRKTHMSPVSLAAGQVIIIILFLIA